MFTIIAWIYLVVVRLQQVAVHVESAPDALDARLDVGRVAAGHDGPLDDEQRGGVVALDEVVERHAPPLRRVAEHIHTQVVRLLDRVQDLLVGALHGRVACGRHKAGR